jgi:hypothetical protein
LNKTLSNHSNTNQQQLQMALAANRTDHDLKGSYSNHYNNNSYNNKQGISTANLGGGGSGGNVFPTDQNTPNIASLINCNSGQFQLAQSFSDETTAAMVAAATAVASSSNPTSISNFFSSNSTSNNNNSSYNSMFMNNSQTSSTNPTQQQQLLNYSHSLQNHQVPNDRLHPNQLHNQKSNKNNLIGASGSSGYYY